MIIAEREREREISQLRTRIAELEAIVNRTSAQEQELQAKRAELARLENQQQSGGGDPKKPTNYLAWIIGGIGVIAVLFLVVFVWYKKRKK